MVSLINLGGLGTVNGKNVLTGSSSGIDTQALVTALSTAKRLPAVQLEQSITKNNSQITALTDLKASLKKFQDSLNTLRNTGGFGSAATNVFESRIPYLTMTGGKTAADYVGVTTANGAPIGKYEIIVNELAQAEARQSIAFADRTSSLVEAGGGDTAGKFSAGTFQINGINVTFNEGDNLNDIAASINSVQSQSNVTASIVKFSNTDYRLVLNSKNSGVAGAITINDPDEVFPSAAIMTVKQVAQDAEFEFNGELITRSSNKINDLVDNVTFSLYQETGADKVTLDVDKDSTKVATSVGNFIDAYNEIRVFVSKQQEKNADGKLKSTAVLNNNSTMNTIVNRISSLMSGQVSTAIPSFYSTGEEKAPLRLGDLGITFTDFAGDSSDPENPIPATSNILTADAAALSSKLETYFEDVRKIFEFNFTASNAGLSTYKHDNTVTQAKFTVAVDESQVDDNLKARITHVDGQELATPIYLQYEISSGQKIIKGAAGSQLESFTFLYSGNGNDSVERDSPLTQKSATISVNTANPAESKAQLTHLYGYELATPVNMKFVEGESSSTIEGMPGTSFAGLQMIYTGDGTDTINMSVEQGIADKMFNSLEEMLSSIDGQANLIDTAIENLQKSNDTLQTSIDRIDDQIVAYRDQLLERFSALEAAITAANNILTLLGAQADARNNS